MLERWIRDESVDPSADQKTNLAVNSGPLHGALSHRRIDVTGEGVSCLVIMVVGVEDRKIDQGTSPSGSAVWYPRIRFSFPQDETAAVPKGDRKRRDGAGGGGACAG